MSNDESSFGPANRVSQVLDDNADVRKEAPCQDRGFACQRGLGQSGLAGDTLSM